jgi:hypothetical protein
MKIQYKNKRKLIKKYKGKIKSLSFKVNLGKVYFMESLEPLEPLEPLEY